MRFTTLRLCGMALLAASPLAQAAPLQPPLTGLAFLAGHWASNAGQVAQTGGTSRGTSGFSVEAGGAVLLRRDHVLLFDKAGKQSGSFDILMPIYRENGTLRADYFDGTHIIHYTKSDIVPGKSVGFSSTAGAAGPPFKLTYSRRGNVLTVVFGIMPPGQAPFQIIAQGSLLRAP